MGIAGSRIATRKGPEAGRRVRSTGRPADLTRRSGGQPGPAIFLVGPARSGTSLLYKVLCLHPETAFISNWVARFPERPWLAALNRLARRFPGEARRVWFAGGGNAYVYGRRRTLRERLFPMPVEGEPVFARCGVPDGPAPGSALRRAVARICRFAGGSVFVNKRVANNRRIPFLAAAFPEARFLWIVRDGRAVAYSLSRVDWWEGSVVWWYGGTPAQWVAEGRDPWELCARNWVAELQAVEEGIQAVPADRVLRLSYESLVADPPGTLRRVAEFLRLPRAEEWLRLATGLPYPDRNQAWRVRLDPRAVATITAVQAARLEAYGYELGERRGR